MGQACFVLVKVRVDFYFLLTSASRPRTGLSPHFLWSLEQLEPAFQVGGKTALPSPLVVG